MLQRDTAAFYGTADQKGEAKPRLQAVKLAFDSRVTMKIETNLWIVAYLGFDLMGEGVFGQSNKWKEKKLDRESFRENNPIQDWAVKVVCKKRWRKKNQAQNVNLGSDRQSFDSATTGLQYGHLELNMACLQGSL
ncbi:hypothetical protein DdX_12223 [Ditylenchus destructor]|uniref:Uncharacterized protein n=1 Tax=Ditylenchus destructor TaxID=166010 RepID=A0AAD4MZ21_9BILA|nr:hypothetical protein DdX_12223 [Ditylenchus destructor]